MLALSQTPFSSSVYLPLPFSVKQKRKKQQNHRKQNRTLRVMYALCSIYTVITTNTITADQYFRSINNYDLAMIPLQASIL